MGDKYGYALGGFSRFPYKMMSNGARRREERRVERDREGERREESGEGRRGEDKEGEGKRREEKENWEGGKEVK